MAKQLSILLLDKCRYNVRLTTVGLITSLSTRGSASPGRPLSSLLNNSLFTLPSRYIRTREQLVPCLEVVTPRYVLILSSKPTSVMSSVQM